MKKFCGPAVGLLFSFRFATHLYVRFSIQLCVVLKVYLPITLFIHELTVQECDATGDAIKD